MQVFPCPFCGDRDETEFRYLGESGKIRPTGGETVPADTWTDYLYFQHAIKGRAAEIWSHSPCGEVFRLDRDNVTHSVFASVTLRAEEGS